MNFTTLNLKYGVYFIIQDFLIFKINMKICFIQKIQMFNFGIAS